MKRSRLGASLRGIGALLAAALLTATAIVFIAASLLAARPGEWSVPLRVGTADVGMRIDASVAALLRVATHPLALRLLDGRSVDTRFGVLRLARIDDERFSIACSPCRLQLPALGDEALTVASLQVVGTRRDDTVRGTLSAGEIAGRFQGRIDDDGMTLELWLDRAPIAAWYAVFGRGVPERAAARIEGTAALAVRVRLPAATVDVTPTVVGFSVSGLGTERLAGATPRVACAKGSDSASTGSPGRWLPRAVIAAEDQRYYTHPGYDIEELAASLSRNQSAARIERGASTIPQQLAKLLFVGSDRSIDRKLRELLYAVEMERTLGKARMLQLYLAVAPWGEGICGADAAALHYFATPAAKLSGAQAVWLAAMLHAPDREAQAWAATGHIDTVRALRIAQGMGTVPPAARARVIAALPTIATRSALRVATAQP